MEIFSCRLLKVINTSCTVISMSSCWGNVHGTSHNEVDVITHNRGCFHWCFSIIIVQLQRDVKTLQTPPIILRKKLSSAVCGLFPLLFFYSLPSVLDSFTPHIVVFFLEHHLRGLLFTFSIEISSPKECSLSVASRYFRSFLISFASLVWVL